MTASGADPGLTELSFANLGQTPGWSECLDGGEDFLRVAGHLHPSPDLRELALPVETFDEARRALRFTLTMPITAAVSPSHADLLWWACDAAEGLSPLSNDEAAEVAALSEGLAPIFPHDQE